MTDFNRWAVLKEQEDYLGPPLRSWQERALLKWEANSHQGVIEAITGTGKSMVGVAAIHEVLSYGGVATVIVPTRALVVQWSKTLRETLPGIRIGQLSDGNKDDFGPHDVIVATIQSIYKAPLRQRSLMLLVADEVHRYGSEKYQAALTDDYSWRMALTGTYERQQDDGIEQYLQPFLGMWFLAMVMPKHCQTGLLRPSNSPSSRLHSPSPNATNIWRQMSAARMPEASSSDNSDSRRIGGSSSPSSPKLQVAKSQAASETSVSNT